MTLDHVQALIVKEIKLLQQKVIKEQKNDQYQN